MNHRELAEWYEHNEGLLATFVRSHSTLINGIELIFNDGMNRFSYVLIKLNGELTQQELVDLEADFEDVFPNIDYATENIEPDPFWNKPFPQLPEDFQES